MAARAKKYDSQLLLGGLPKGLRDRFKAACAKRGVSMRERLIVLMEADCRVRRGAAVDVSGTAPRVQRQQLPPMPNPIAKKMIDQFLDVNFGKTRRNARRR